MPSPRAGSAHAELDVDGGVFDPIDAHVLALDSDQESPFLRAQKRVPVRRGPLPKKTVNKLKYVAAALAILAVLAVIAGLLDHYARTSWRFRLESSDQVRVTGNHNVSRAQVMEIFGQDISRNLFAIPLPERKAQLERIPWVESATVMRLLPNRVSVAISERTPTAFAQIGSRIFLVDATGVLMDIRAEGENKYSFPVILGMGEAEPLSKRAASMRIYVNLLRELDSGGANYSHDIDEVDLADPEDVKITVTNPEGQVLIHLGSAHFLDRYKLFIAHAQEWRQQFQKLDSVDLRYDRQVIVNPDGQRPARPDAAPSTATPAAAASHAATSAGAPVHPPAHGAKPKARASRWSARKHAAKPSAVHHNPTPRPKPQSQTPADFDE